ncbi:MAG: Cell division ATP-binding protein FtsE [Candidatus Magasanikbacteria bacterium GW2011_GWA2_56_11]|uniref:Cell division ATP-binding protein FtsE n=1 Tax=Candidatus Magasanikbacteria bacterium GW2011_GWA2_56_11 TaxID=1619044 RepID=A0A0G2AK86_9BACT|nr:MAG: Cell division ATP-binding protein FtsE [Candidatus Magasanikbacteria bacterium GW2011_GWA2_56_11]
MVEGDGNLFSMIRLQGVSKQYAENSVGLSNIHLAIEAGEFVSVVGQSGTGKTTLVKLLIAEEQPTSGRIEVGGWDISRLPRRDVPVLRRQIGVIFQDFKLLPKKTVAENIAFALEVAGETRARIRRVIPQVLDIVGIGEKHERYPHQLSGGEQQRVAIARALVHRPKILVADEPTGNLDAINTHEIIEILKKINSFGTTVLLVTHNREIVNHLAKRVITLLNGAVVADEVKGKYRLS